MTCCKSYLMLLTPVQESIRPKWYWLDQAQCLFQSSMLVIYVLWPLNYLCNYFIVVWRMGIYVVLYSFEHHVTLVRHPGCYPGFVLTKSPPFLPFGEYNSPSGIYYVYQLHLLRWIITKRSGCGRYVWPPWTVKNPRSSSRCTTSWYFVNHDATIDSYDTTNYSALRSELLWTDTQ